MHIKYARADGIPSTGDMSTQRNGDELGGGAGYRWTDTTPPAPRSPSKPRRRVTSALPARRHESRISPSARARRMASANLFGDEAASTPWADAVVNDSDGVVGLVAADRDDHDGTPAASDRTTVPCPPCADDEMTCGSTAACGADSTGVHVARDVARRVRSQAGTGRDQAWQSTMPTASTSRWRRSLLRHVRRAQRQQGGGAAVVDHGGDHSTVALVRSEGTGMPPYTTWGTRHRGREVERVTGRSHPTRRPAARSLRADRPAARPSLSTGVVQCARAHERVGNRCSAHRGPSRWTVERSQPAPIGGTPGRGACSRSARPWRSGVLRPLRRPTPR